MEDEPSAVEAERVVLGAMMSSPAALSAALERLDPTAIYDWRHAEIFRAVVACRTAAEPTEPISVARRLAADGTLPNLGGVPYLHTLVEVGGALTGQVTYYAGLILDAADRRRVMGMAVRLRRVADIDLPTERGAALAAVRDELAGVTRAGTRGLADMMLIGGAFTLDVPKQVPAIWGAGDRVFWAEGEAFMLVGPAGVGKTTLAGQVVLGRLGLLPVVLGLPVTPGAGRVLWLAADRPSQIRRSLARQVVEEWREILDDRLAIWPGPPPKDFATSPELLRQMCEAAGADTVVVDSLKDVALNLAKDEGGAGYNRARQLAIQAGVELLELHHQRKSGESDRPPTSLADVYGSTWLTAGAGSVALLWGKAGDMVVRMSHIKQPGDPVGPWDIIHDPDTGMSTVAGDNDLETLAARTPGGLSAAAAASVMYVTESPTRAERERARRELERLERSGRLVSGPGERVPGVSGPPQTVFRAVFRGVESETGQTLP